MDQTINLTLHWGDLLAACGSFAGLAVALVMCQPWRDT